MAPPFDVFFAAVHRGRTPLPWQARLAALVASDGWPEEIGVPTGLGKTSCLDIAVWALAEQASRSPRDRSLPTRIWYVVNRRLLVDAATAHGEELAALLAQPALVTERWSGASHEHLGALADVAGALASMAALGVATGPLHTVRLRGGAELGARPPDPSQPSLIFATVPMFASRWLFRGYGTSTSMRPVDAALAGLDSLVLLDEAHLATALAALEAPLADCDVGDPSAVLPAGRSRPRFVALTATGEPTAVRFDLDGDDLAHPVVRQRIDAAKPTRLVSTNAKQLPAVLAAEATQLINESRSSCLVFANTPARARAVAEILRRDIGRDVILATGRVREREAEVVRARLLDPVTGVPAGRGEIRPASAPLWVVATQTLEVGADIDVDALVTETAGTRALTQRFGRLNRLGKRPGAAAVICHAPDLVQPLYGDEPAQVWARIAETEQPLPMGPAVIAGALGAPTDSPRRGAEPLPALVWEWAKTSMPPVGEAPPEAYYAPDDDDVARVSVCWRAHRPDAGVPLNPPVTAAESVDVPIGELRAALEEHRPAELRRLGDDRVTLEAVTPQVLRPGDVVVLAPGDGLYDEFGWNPHSRNTVLDAGLLHAAALPLTREVFANLLTDDDDIEELAEMVAELAAADADGDSDAGSDRVWADKTIELLRSAVPHPWITPDEWGAFIERLQPTVARPVGDIAFLPPSPRRAPLSAEVRSDAFDQLSFDATSVALAEHLGSVGETAGRIARHLGLPETLVDAVHAAGRWHDLGKADPRFQRWLDPTATSPVPLAKSGLSRFEIESARIAAGWPRGGRHEAISGLLVRAFLDGYDFAGVDAELVVHLVVTHHGHGRPTLPIATDPTGAIVEAAIDGTLIRLNAHLSDTDWSQPGRFRHACEHYGLWGLALLEAVVRQADQAVSSAVVA